MQKYGFFAKKANILSVFEDFCESEGSELAFQPERHQTVIDDVTVCVAVDEVFVLQRMSFSTSSNRPII